MILENRRYQPLLDREREEEKENDEINEGGESDLRIKLRKTNQDSKFNPFVYV